MDVKELCEDICKLKEYVLELDYKNLKKYKEFFYKKDIAKWQLDLIWEFIWDDRDYEEVIYILKKKKII